MAPYHVSASIYGALSKLHVVLGECPCLVCEHIVNLKAYKVYSEHTVNLEGAQGVQ